MYEVFYRLDGSLFRLAPDHRNRFLHASYERAFADALAATRLGEGFIVLCAGPGAGKTTLVEELAATLAAENRRVGRVANAQVDADTLLQLVGFAFGLDADTLGKAVLLTRIERLLAGGQGHKRPALLIVDEAQHLSTGALEALRLLSNLAADGEPLMQILLCGQERLNETLRRPECAPLRPRIVASCTLGPLSARETRGYIAHRLVAAGWTGDPAIGSDALRSLHKWSGGVPGLINLIMGRLLLHGSLCESHALGARDVESVAEGLGRDRPDPLFDTGLRSLLDDTGAGADEPIAPLDARAAESARAGQPPPERTVEGRSPPAALPLPPPPGPQGAPGTHTGAAGVRRASRGLRRGLGWSAAAAVVGGLALTVALQGDGPWPAWWDALRRLDAHRVADRPALAAEGRAESGAALRPTGQSAGEGGPAPDDTGRPDVARPDGTGTQPPIETEAAPGAEALGEPMVQPAPEIGSDAVAQSGGDAGSAASASRSDPKVRPGTDSESEAGTQAAAKAETAAASESGTEVPSATEPASVAEPRPGAQPESGTEAQSAAPTATAAQLQPEAEIATLLAQAERAFSQDRLTLPAGDNAYEGYRSVLDRDPENVQAKTGLTAVQARYRTLVKARLNRGDREGARRLGARGLDLWPDDHELSAIVQRAASPRVADRSGSRTKRTTRSRGSGYTSGFARSERANGESDLAELQPAEPSESHEQLMKRLRTWLKEGENEGADSEIGRYEAQPQRQVQAEPREDAESHERLMRRLRTWLESDEGAAEMSASDRLR